MVDHGATLQDVAIAADLGSELNVLLGNQDGNTLGQQVLYHDGQLVHDDGGQTFGDLVQQHHLGVLHQAAGNRQHLLLTAGKLITLGVLAFLQAGEEFVHRFQVPLIAAVHALTCCHTQVFLGGQGGENVAALGHVGNAQAGDCVALHADQFFAVEGDGAFGLTVFFRVQHAHDGFHRGGFADTVAAQQADRSAFLNAKVDAVQDMALVIISLYIFQFKNHDMSPPR